jgi:hypothetical protein
VAAEFGLESGALISRSCRARVPKKAAVELGCRYSGLSQRKVGEYFGYKGNAEQSASGECAQKAHTEGVSPFRIAWPPEHARHYRMIITVPFLLTARVAS